VTSKNSEASLTILSPFSSYFHCKVTIISLSPCTQAIYSNNTGTAFRTQSQSTIKTKCLMLFREITALIVRIIRNALPHHARKMQFLCGTKSCCQPIRPIPHPLLWPVYAWSYCLLPTLFLGHSSPNFSTSFIFIRHLFKHGHFSGAMFTA
jgi:hypothetical protein